MDIKTDKIKLSAKFIDRYLSFLEERIDQGHVKTVTQKQIDVFNFKPVPRLPVLITTRNDVAHRTSEQGQWPVFSFDHMWNDYSAMILNELLPVYESVLIKDDKIFTIRPNLSQIVAPSLFGAEGGLDMVNVDSMPYIDRTPEKNELMQVITNGIDFKNHWSIRKYCKIIDTWRQILLPYPKLKDNVHFALPDLQGPFNLYFLLRGVEAYIDLYKAPDFTHKIMAFITNILIDITNYLVDYIGNYEMGFYWNYIFPGRIRNVDDNATQISREQYLEFVHPYNLKLAEACGGGIHHYCGPGDHIIDDIMSIPGNYGLNFGNPEMQNWDLVYKKALHHRTVLLWDQEIPVKKFRKFNQGVIMKIVVPSLEIAQKKAVEFQY